MIAQRKTTQTALPKILCFFLIFVSPRSCNVSEVLFTYGVVLLTNQAQGFYVADESRSVEHG